MLMWKKARQGKATTRPKVIKNVPSPWWASQAANLPFKRDQISSCDDLFQPFLCEWKIVTFINNTMVMVGLVDDSTRDSWIWMKFYYTLLFIARKISIIYAQSEVKFSLKCLKFYEKKMRDITREWLFTPFACLLFVERTLRVIFNLEIKTVLINHELRTGNQPTNQRRWRRKREREWERQGSQEECRVRSNIIFIISEIFFFFGFHNIF